MPQGQHTQTIVVGVDGSPTAAAALSWAVEEAARRGCPVRAVTAAPQDAPGYFVEGIAEQIDTVGRHRPGVALSHVYRTGAPGKVLVADAADAAMLVVGSHGVGRIVSVLLGSVTAYCVRFAGCPVVVVPNTMAVRETATAPMAEPALPGPLL
ncbi:universal stress protein [Actinokineospora alba]|nr:universal stress protein [Actinokineospora alba]